MSLPQFLVMAVVALLVTIPVVLLIPRAHTSPTFDRLLWAATVVVGFLVAWVAVAVGKNANVLDAFEVGDTPILPTVIGALGGALTLTLPLWLLDRFEGSTSEEPAVLADPDTQTFTPDESLQDRK
jgi:hypothetical protein